jgi:hypothetical protein
MATRSSIDISNAPDLVRLAEEVQSTNQPRILTLAGHDVAMIAPLPGQRAVRPRYHKKASRAEKYPTVASLAGAAGTLPVPANWEDLRESAREEHLAAKFRSHA